MVYLKTEDRFERAIHEMVLNEAHRMWANEMSIAVANGIIKAFGK